MSENYLMLNGKRIDLTEEQMKTLGIEVKKDPFAKVALGETYYAISSTGNVVSQKDLNYPQDFALTINANYCTDKDLMEQRALHETLNRLLWRYSMQNDGEMVGWLCGTNWRIVYSHSQDRFKPYDNDDYHTIGAVYFVNRETAEAAIEEVVKPFMEQHPEFKW